jgi:hypothetical protein
MMWYVYRKRKGEELIVRREPLFSMEGWVLVDYIRAELSEEEALELAKERQDLHIYD